MAGDTGMPVPQPVLSGSLDALRDIGRAIQAKDAEIRDLRAAAGGYAAEVSRLRALHAEAARLLGEAAAENARLQAELDAASDHPVEYVTTSGLEAAMAADPHREDGTILRCTDGQRQAFAWNAPAGQWELLPGRG